MSTRYLSILAQQSPFSLGTDIKNRVIWSCNYRVSAQAPSDKFEEEMVKLIVDAGLGISGTSLFIGPSVVIPDGAGPFVLIKNTGGNSPLAAHSGVKIERLSLQVLVYATSYVTGRTRALAIWRLLDGKYNVTVAA